MKLKTIAAWLMIFVLSLNAASQQGRVRPAQMDDVIKLSKAGIADDVIISRIDKKIELTTEELLELKKVGVSDRVILWMTTQVDSNKTATTLMANDVSDVGFYLVDENTKPLPTSAFTTQRAGTKGWILTSGIAKTKQKASVPGSSASVRSTNRQPTFLYYGPEGVAATDYLLVRLDKKKDTREIKVGESNILGSSVGFEKDRIMSFSISKSGLRRWLIKVDESLRPGEYAFYPSSGIQPSGLGVSAAGRLYEFGID